MTTQIEDFDDPTFDPLVADEIMFGDREDTHTVAAELRRRGAVVAGDVSVAMGQSPAQVTDQGPHYMALSFDAVDTVLNNPEIYSNAPMALRTTFGRTLTSMDAPEHVRYRRIFQKAFLPGVVQGWGQAIVQPVIDKLMGQFDGDSRADLVNQFTRPYPFQVIYRMLGLPPEDIETFFKLTLAQTMVKGWRDKAIEASEKLGRYFKVIVDERRSSPGGDLVSTLATTEFDGETLPDDVLISFFRQLINAGGDTTFRTTSVLLVALLSNPDQLEAVRRDRTLIAPAIEEALRWEGPVFNVARETVKDTQLAGVALPRGAVVDVVLGAANRDETEFEDPDAFNIFRPKHRQFGFAWGPHVCLGQHLARLEITRAVTAILDLPHVRLDPDFPSPTIHGVMMRVPRKLHVLIG